MDLTPERRDGESFTDYKARRKAGQQHVARLLRGAPTDKRLLGKGPSSTDRERASARARRPHQPQPKFAKARVHRQHKHQLRDEHGAYTLVGKPYALDGVHPSSREAVLTGWVDGDEYGYTVQRKWLAGVSAQRGF